MSIGENERYAVADLKDGYEMPMRHSDEDDAVATAAALQKALGGQWTHYDTLAEHKTVEHTDEDGVRILLSLAPKGSLLVSLFEDDEDGDEVEDMVYLSTPEVQRLKAYLTTPETRKRWKPFLHFCDQHGDQLVVRRCNDGWLSWWTQPVVSNRGMVHCMPSSVWDQVLAMLKGEDA